MDKDGELTRREEGSFLNQKGDSGLMLGLKN
jgi:hypothetical protein